MGIRMSGLVSGLDTESIVKELMKAKSAKKTKVEASKTKLEWKQEKWAELNTKLYKLYTDYASKLKLSGNYNLKKASSSNENVASIKADSKAANGSYSLQVMQLATSQYVTGGKVNGAGVKSSTKLSAIDPSLVGSEITIKSGSKTVNLQINDNTKISDLVSAFQSAGLNANFDESQQRFFINSKSSGAESLFSITTTKLSEDELEAREKLRNDLQYNALSTGDKSKVDAAFEVLRSASKDSDEYKKAVNSLNAIATKNAKTETNALATNYKAALLYTEMKAAKESDYLEEAKKDYYEVDEETGLTTNAIKEDVANSIKEDLILNGMITEDTTEEEVNELVQEALDEVVKKNVENRLTTEVSVAIKQNEAKADIADFAEHGLRSDEIATAISNGKLSQEAIDKYDIKPFDSLRDATDAEIEKIKDDVDAYADIGADNRGSVSVSALSNLGLGDIDEDGKSLSTSGGMALVEAQDSVIILNNAELTSSSTTVKVNGLTIDLKAETKGEVVTFSVSNDVEATYKLVKDFLTQYNDIMKEMNTLLRAPSARGYEPLTDEEKEAMSEKQIELWEDKIKSSLFRSDNRLNSIASSMRNAMMSSVEIDGKKYTLSSLGIMTSSDYTENGLLHIFGDKEDSTYADRDDKLMKMLTEDPDLAIKILSGITGNLSDTMFDQMKSTKLSSALTFYNDKQMSKIKEGYEDQIKIWEKRLNKIENQYYKQFTAMEKAMSSLNSQSNYLSNLMGG